MDKLQGRWRVKCFLKEVLATDTVSYQPSHTGTSASICARNAASSFVPRILQREVLCSQRTGFLFSSFLQIYSIHKCCPLPPPTVIFATYLLKCRFQINKSTGISSTCSFLSLKINFPFFHLTCQSFRYLHNQEKALFLPFCRFTDIKTRRKYVLSFWSADLSACVEPHLFIPIIS